MTGTISIKRSMLVNLLLVVILLSAATLVTTFVGASEALKSLSSQLINQTIARVETRLHGFFNPVKRGIQIAQSWGNKGMLDIDKPDQLQKILLPLIKQHNQVSSMMVADTRGREYMLLQTPNQWQSRITKKDIWENKALMKIWRDNSEEFQEVYKQLDYDPRVRPWFLGAEKLTRHSIESSPEIATSLISWTTPYVFFTTKDPGITASVSYSSDDNNINIIGFDVLLRDISEFTTSLKVSEQGKVFILTGDRRIVGLPIDDQFTDKTTWNNALLKTPDQLGVTVIADAARAYDALQGGYSGPFTFETDNQTWWAGGKPYQLNADQTLWIAVVVPESDLLGELFQLRIWIAVISLCVLLIAISRSISLAKRYSQPLEKLVSQSDRISRGDLQSHQKIHSPITEIRRLADAQDRMRIGLISLLKMERDLQLAQKIQRNTFPAELPILPGFDLYAWSEPAEHAGGDTYDVIGIDNNRKIVQNRSSAQKGIFLLADATGHGIGPAISVSQVRAMLRMAVRTRLRVPAIANHMNAQLCGDLHGGRFITAWLGELFTEPPQLHSFSAGQAPLLYYQASTRTVTKFDADSPPLGIVPELNTDIGVIFDFEAGDIFCALSDGIYESTNEHGEQFSIDRIIDILRENAAFSPKDIYQKIEISVDRFCKGVKLADDKTGIIIKYAEDPKHHNKHGK